MKHRRKTSTIATLKLFPDDPDVPTPKPSKRSISESIIRRETELKHGQMDYDRLLPLRGEYERGADVKHSNRVKVNGEWMDVRLVRATHKFLSNWKRRKSQLEWEISELYRQLVGLE